MKTNTSQPEADSATPGDRPAEERRRLLRAAAAAPFVATIPSGAAHAMASASACVIVSKNQSDEQVPQLTESGPDRWVRRKVTVRRFGTVINGTPETVDLYLINGAWYDIAGNTVTPNLDPDCDFATEYCPVAPPQDTWVLEIYKPDSSSTGIEELPHSVYRVGPYPQESLFWDTNRSPQEPMENMGITGSCLCSVAPTEGAGGAC